MEDMIECDVCGQVYETWEGNFSNNPSYEKNVCLSCSGEIDSHRNESIKNTLDGIEKEIEERKAKDNYDLFSSYEPQETCKCCEEPMYLVSKNMNADHTWLIAKFVCENKMIKYFHREEEEYKYKKCDAYAVEKAFQYNVHDVRG